MSRISSRRGSSCLPLRAGDGGVSPSTLVFAVYYPPVALPRCAYRCFGRGPSVDSRHSLGAGAALPRGREKSAGVGPDGLDCPPQRGGKAMSGGAYLAPSAIDPTAQHQ